MFDFSFSHLSFLSVLVHERKGSISACMHLGAYIRASLLTRLLSETGSCSRRIALPISTAKAGACLSYLHKCVPTRASFANRLRHSEDRSADFKSEGLCSRLLAARVFWNLCYIVYLLYQL